MANVGIYDMTDTWNAGGTTFTAIKMNVTDTASAAGSKLLDIQKGGSSYLELNKSGELGILDKIFHLGDTNTAIRFPAADTVTVETGGSERMRIDSSGKVGIGVTGPSTALTIGGPNNVLTFDRYSNGGQNAAIGPVDLGARSALLFYVNTSNTGAPSEQFRFGDGYLRLASGTGGIQFNGDTAAANALDDYEEGTWTPSLGGITGTITYSYQVGTYTKIGNTVQLRFRIGLASYSSTAGPYPHVSGLPFTTANISDLYPQSPVFLENVTYTGESWVWGNPNLNLLYLASIASGGTFTHIDHTKYSATTFITGNIVYQV